MKPDSLTTCSAVLHPNRHKWWEPPALLTCNVNCLEEKQVQSDAIIVERGIG